MQQHRYRLVTYDDNKPSIVVSTEDRTVELPAGQSFSEWAHEHHPGPTVRVVEQPGGLGVKQREYAEDDQDRG